MQIPNIFWVYCIFSLGIACIGICGADTTTYGTNWVHNGELHLNWMVNPYTDLTFVTSPVPSETFVHTFDASGPNVPWVIEPFSCFGLGCNRRIRFTDFGAAALANQIVEINIVVTGKNGNVFPTIEIGHAKFNFKLYIQHPDGTQVAGLTSIDSWLKDFIFDPNAVVTQPNVMASFVIPPGTIQSGSVVRISGYGEPYDILNLIFTEGNLEGEKNPNREAGFGLRIFSRPSSYAAVEPLKTIYAQGQFQSSAAVSLHFKNRVHTNSAPYELGYSSAFAITPGIVGNGLSAELIPNTPTTGYTGLRYVVNNETEFVNQYLLVDFVLCGSSQSNSARVFVAYVCINGTGGDLCSIEPLVQFQDNSRFEWRYIYNVLLIPNNYLKNGATIHIYGDVYSGGTETLSNIYQPSFRATYSLTIRGVHNVYPG